jgi:hypothetical protein
MIAMTNALAVATVLTDYGPAVATPARSMRNASPPTHLSMRPLLNALAIAPFVATLVLAATATAQMQDPASASTTRDTTKKVFVVAGERAGPSVFPLTSYAEVKPLVPGQLDWKHYHTSAEIEAFMRQWAERRPEIVQLYEVGKSFAP